MLSRERQRAWMWKIKTGGLDQYGVEPFKQQQFGTAGVQGVKTSTPVIRTGVYPHMPIADHREIQWVAKSVS